MLNIPRLLIDGAILSGLATLFIILTMRLNPRLWLQDYPEDIQASVPPKTPEERKLSLQVGIPFILLLLAVPLVSTFLVKQQAGSHMPFWSLFVHAFGVVFLFNVYDWLVLDWLMFCTITPDFVVIPGTEGMAGYKDYIFHFTGFLKGIIFSAFGGLIITVIVYLL